MSLAASPEAPKTGPDSDDAEAEAGPSDDLSSLGLRLRARLLRPGASAALSSARAGGEHRDDSGVECSVSTWDGRMGLEQAATAAVKAAR